MRNVRQIPRATICTGQDFGCDHPSGPVPDRLHDERPSPSDRHTSLTRRRANYLLIAGIVFSVAGVGRVVDAERSLSVADAIGFIRQSGDRLVAILTGPGALPEKRRQLIALIEEKVDVCGIVRVALGRFWNAASEAQRDEYARLFPAILLNDIGLGNEAYRAMEFIAERGTPLDDEVQVRTTVLLPGVPPMHVGWTVALIGGTAKIVDVIEEGVSLRITQRDQCASFLAQNNFSIDALLKTLRRQAAVTS